jgi:hypothetical protein
MTAMGWKDYADSRHLEQKTSCSRLSEESPKEM